MAEEIDTPVNTAKVNYIDNVNNIGQDITDDMKLSMRKALGTMSSMVDPSSGLSYTPVSSSTKKMYEEYGISTNTGVPGGTWKSIIKNPSGEPATDAYKGDMGYGPGNSPVINPPFQFNEHDDVRSDSYYPNIGRIYNTDIKSNFPIVAVEVGRIKYSSFLKNIFSGSTGSSKQLSEMIKGKRNFVTGGVMKVKGVVTSAIQLVTHPVATLFGYQKYVTFVNDTGLYSQFFDETAAQLAAMMGLGITADMDGKANVDDEFATDEGGNKDSGEGETFTGDESAETEKSNMSKALAYGKKLWKADSYQGRMGAPVLSEMLPGTNLADRMILPFLLGKGSSATESISNSTEANPMAGAINDKAQEASNAKKTSGIKDIEKLTGASVAEGLMNKLKNTITSVGKGQAGFVMGGNGRILLPDIWSNSTFSRSYSLNLEFRTPYSTDLAIYENVYLPFLMWLVMASPRQIGKNSYTSPFFIRMSARGWFNCPMGIIESMSITRGEDKNNWSVNSKPTSIKLAVTIKDMTPSMMIGLNKGIFSSLMVNNDGFSSYLKTLGGVSIADSRTFLGNAKIWWDTVKQKTGAIRKGGMSRYFVSHSSNFIIKKYIKVQNSGIVNKVGDEDLMQIL